MAPPQTAMLDWTSASVPSRCLYPTDGRRHPTRTQHSGDKPPVGAMPLGHRGDYRLSLSHIQAQSCIRYCLPCASKLKESWRKDVVLNRSLLVVTWAFFRLKLQSKLLAPCQISDHCQMMCGGYKVDICCSRHATSHPTHQSPSEGLRIQPNSKVHYAGMIADSNAYTLKIGGTNTRLSAASAWPSLPLALRTLGNRKIGAVHLVLLKVLAEVLSVVAVKQFLSVTSGSSSWGFSRHLQWCLPSCGSAIVLLATCCPATCSNA